jgi:hypothetical protein
MYFAHSKNFLPPVIRYPEFIQRAFEGRYYICAMVFVNHQHSGFYVV